MTTQTRPVAKGTRDPRFPEHLQTVSRFEDETFGEIRMRTIAEGTSINEQVRILVEWGLEAARGDAEQ
mgnify:CR=1 FL=1